MPDPRGTDTSYIELSSEAAGRTPREISRLIAAVSHEIISPVSNIAGFSRMLATDPDAHLDKKTRDLVSRIRRNAVRLTHLAFKLLSFFCRSASRVYSREQLLREVWGIRQARRAC